jgi:hypothetical protein
MASSLIASVYRKATNAAKAAALVKVPADQTCACVWPSGAACAICGCVFFHIVFLVRCYLRHIVE